ncbi:MAG: flavin reductase family protein [Gammaproteobacteria bacterium]|nr:flavin reductase family protein [Gammaproteobacteria bacterium]MDH5345876.1 flavin reductase family protein [Gammaproteobacteria bacterium]
MTDTREFRRCLGRFATGVTVVTCSNRDGEPRGITANSFSSVSLDPPLVLWNIAKVSNSLQAFLGAEHFAINVLSSEQQALSTHFARSDHTLFDTIDYRLSGDGMPILPGTIATFECRTHEIHDCGDHHIIVGEVLAWSAADGDPLLFYRGAYRRIAGEQGI